MKNYKHVIAEAKRELSRYNHLTERADTDGVGSRMSSWPQPLCSLCCYHWSDTYQTLDGPEYDAGCNKITADAYYGVAEMPYTEEGREYIYTDVDGVDKVQHYKVDCGSFSPKRKWRELLLKWEVALLEATIKTLQARSASELIVPRDSLKRDRQFNVRLDMSFDLPF